MVLYLSSEENKEQFSAFVEEQGDFLDFTALETITTLKNSLAQNRAMQNYHFILFHFTEKCPMPTEDLLEAVSFMQKFHHAKPIVFAPESPATTLAFGRLIDMNVREVVSYNDSTNLELELEECMSAMGKSFADSIQIATTARIEEARQYVRSALDIPEGFILKIGLAGAQARTGVTTQAFGFYHTLRELGFKPCIIDTGQAFISYLLDLYGDEDSIDGSILHIGGMDFSSDIQVGIGYNAYIYDCNTLSGNSIKEYRNCDIRLICTGAKGWEIPHLSRTLQTYVADIHRIIFSFVSSSDEKEVLDLIDEVLPASFAPYVPDIWRQGSNEWQDEFLVPMIKELMPH